ncbi:sensor histidine kinase [Pseudomonas sp. HK3]
MRKLLVYSTEADQLQPFIPKQYESIFFSNAKSLNKTVRSNAPTELFLHITELDQVDIVLGIGEYIRSGLSNGSIWLRIFIEEGLINEQEKLSQSALFNDIIILGNHHKALINQSNTQLIDHVDTNKKLIEEKDAQTQMLSSINRFSHHRQPMQQLVQSCAEALTQFCHGYSAVLVTPKKIKALKNVHWEIPESTINEMTTQDVNDFINTVMQCKTPKIELLPKNLNDQKILHIIDIEIGSYITFPIVIYNNIIASIVCFIAEKDLDKISTTQLNVMRDTSNQLQIILERRFSESKLASQYQRLKETISELKVTQDQLIHSEKMASVGQMAAGLAHEINNPLAFVIGNFGPLEEYVGTIIDMLNLHDKFVTSLDESTDTSGVKNEVSALKEDNDLDFVISDVKAIVNDSREGLLRVRDIISDLSSFTRKDQLETNTVNIELMINETLRLLKYDINDDVTLSHTINASSELVSHRGFIQQILTNLIKNSNHALEDQPENKDKAIILKVYESNNNIIFSVSDNGPGIPSSIKTQIFDPFYTTKEIGKGTGLGLSVSYNLAKKMGGELTVDSDGSTSTEFKLVIPLIHNSSN